MTRQRGNAHLAFAAGELRLYRGGRTYDAGDPFEHIIFIAADEDIAIFRGLRAETKFLITQQDKADIATVLGEAGFLYCAWDRYRRGRKHEYGPFALATWARTDWRGSASIGPPHLPRG